MSTKTSIKRIALVAVSALGLGLLSTVSAFAGTAGASAFSATNTSISTTAGVATTITLRIDSVTSTGADGDTATFTPTSSASEISFGTATVASGASAVNTATAGGWRVAASTAALVISENGDGSATTDLTGKTIGNIVFTASTPGLYTIDVTAGTLTGFTFATTKRTIAVNVSAGANAGLNSFITTATTVDTPGTKADGNATSATALSNADLATLAPGVSKTTSGVYGTTSVATLTAPASSVVVFTVEPTNNVAYSASTKAKLTLNGLPYSTVNVTAADPGVLDSITVPATAGTYSAVLTISGSNGSFDPSFTESINFTLTVGAASSALSELPNTTYTTASSNGSTSAGLLVPSVGVTLSSQSGRVGQMVAFAPNYNVKRNAGADAANSVSLTSRKATLYYSVTGPTGTAVSVVDAKVSGVATTKQAIAGTGNLVMPTPTAAVSTTSPIIGADVYFNPATAGTYTITVFHDSDGNTLLSAGEASATSSVVVNADALPSITFTKFGSNTYNDLKGANKYGQLVKISLRNGTSPWILNTNESLVLTAASSTTDFVRYTSFAQGVVSWNDDLAGSASELTLTASNFDGNGDAWVNVADSTDAGGTFSVSGVINGGTANGASGSFTITTIDTDQATASDLVDYTPSNFGAVKNANDGLGVKGATIAANTAGPTSWYVKPGVATTVSASTVTGTSTYTVYNAIVTDTLGLITGVKGAKYHITSATPTASTSLTTASTTSLSLAIPATTAALASGTTVAELLIDETTDVGIDIKVETAAVTSVAVDPTDLVSATFSIRAASASSNTFDAYVLDQFGNYMAGQAVTAQVTAGRNQQLVATSLVSDVNGKVSFKVTDAYAGALLNSDTLKFISNSQEGVVTINYATYNAPSTVTITGGASEDVAPAVTYSYINTSKSGADATTVKMTATVKDANGATLPAGIKVTWAISGLAGTSAILKDSTTGYDWATSYTDSNGKAVTYVYAWAVGTVSVTATAGTVTSATAGKINFANSGQNASEADARVLSATTEGGVVKAKVVDRYGNPVKGVSITATRVSGTGYFGGSGASSATATTGTDGTVDFVIQGGSAVVDVKTTTLNTGQTSSASGYVGATAVTATGVGASLAPAGVQAVSGLDVAGTTPTSDAIDAANEATDAANAATDAANAAAEAADAATAAAQDAQAAVAALATEVAAMISGIKAQIIRLTNLVVKIQKKVKA